MGTRPEIIKLSPIINKLNSKNSSLILSGQHYSYDMSLKFINELGLKKPDYSLKLSKNNPSLQIGEIITKLSKILNEIKPDFTMIQGDTNTVLAAGITSLKLGIPVVHVESGLRSFDWRMPEEHNRIIVDHFSDLLFASTSVNKKNLEDEKVHGKIFVTGNTVIDSIKIFSKISSIHSTLELNKEYVLLTLHRSENVDNKTTLTNLISAILQSSNFFIFPIHPRTLRKLHDFGLYEKINRSKNIKIIKSVGYFDMIELLKNCKFIVTDSGGIQEEATSPIIRKKVLVLRKTTDRPESVECNLSELVGLEKNNIIKAIKKAEQNPALLSKKSPYGTGNSSKKIIDLLNKFY